MYGLISLNPYTKKPQFITITKQINNCVQRDLIIPKLKGRKWHLENYWKIYFLKNVIYLVELFEKTCTHCTHCTQIRKIAKNLSIMTKKLKKELASIEDSWIKKYTKSTEIVRVYSSDNSTQMAYKIYGGFGVGQSCAIVGVEIKKVGTPEQLDECAAANAAGEDYESHYNGNWLLNCELVVDKIDLVWDKLNELCKRKGNTKKFNKRSLGGIWNVYRIK